MLEIQKRGLDGDVNYKLIDYLRSRNSANVMEANQITIHIDIGNIIVENKDTNESIYDFLNLQMDESKKLIFSVRRYAGSLEDYKCQFIPSIVDIEDEWELEIYVFAFMKFFVAQYNKQYLHGEQPILLRHSAAVKDDVLIETMNENNWHQFPRDSIQGALERVAACDRGGTQDIENQWMTNIFNHLRISFIRFKNLLQEFAYYYRKLLFSSGKHTIIRVFKFAGIQFRNVQEMESLIKYDELFFKLAKTFFSLGKTPISLSPKTLPQIKPQVVDLPSFTNLCQTFSHTAARWMLCTLFTAQLFQEIVVNSPSSDLIIFNALEELLTNCSARVLKANNDRLGRNQLDFTHIKVLVGAYIKMVSKEIEHNHNESTSVEECFEVDEDSLKNRLKRI